MRPQSKSVLAVGALLLLGVVTQLPAAPQKAATTQPTPNYFPLQVGNAWHYQLTANGNKAEMINRILTTPRPGGTPQAGIGGQTIGNGIVGVASKSARRSNDCT